MTGEDVDQSRRAFSELLRDPETVAVLAQALRRTANYEPAKCLCCRALEKVVEAILLGREHNCASCAEVGKVARESLPADLLNKLDSDDSQTF